MNNLHKYPKPHSQTAGRVIDGEAVLILSDVSEVNVLNGVGSRIFELCDGTRTLDQIAKQLVNEYNVDEATAQADVVEFVDDFVAQNILILTDSAN